MPELILTIQMVTPSVVQAMRDIMQATASQTSPGSVTWTFATCAAIVILATLAKVAIPNLISLSGERMLTVFDTVRSGDRIIMRVNRLAKLTLDRRPMLTPLS